MENIPAEFFEDAAGNLSEILDELRAYDTEAFPPPFGLTQKLLRTLHTIKGSAQTFGLEKQASFAHELESYLKGPQRQKPADKKLLFRALEALQENFAAPESEPATALDDLLAQLLVELQAANDRRGPDRAAEMPDNFPPEIAESLGKAEIETLRAAWGDGQEILILQFNCEQKDFVACFSKIRRALDQDSQVIALVPDAKKSTQNKTYFSFIAGTKNSAALTGVLTDFGGRVLFQKKKSKGAQETVESISASNKNTGSQLDIAVMHGEKVASVLGKNVKFETTNTGVIPSEDLSSAVSTILLHLVRNAVDHGIEYPLERLALKKDLPGSVKIAAGEEDGDLVLTVSDDGRGITESERVLEPGFSTAAFVTQFSGRGIGLDAVREAVEEAGGKISIESQPGRGTRFKVNLPLDKARNEK